MTNFALPNSSTFLIKNYKTKCPEACYVVSFVRRLCCAGPSVKDSLSYGTWRSKDRIELALGQGKWLQGQNRVNLRVSLSTDLADG